MLMGTPHLGSMPLAKPNTTILIELFFSNCAGWHWGRKIGRAADLEQRGERAQQHRRALVAPSSLGKKDEQLPLLSSVSELIRLRINRLPYRCRSGEEEDLLVTRHSLEKNFQGWKMIKGAREHGAPLLQWAMLGGDSWYPHPGGHNWTQLNYMVRAVAVGPKLLCMDIS